MAATALNAGSMSLVPSDEERLLRESVYGLASTFGPDYLARLLRVAPVAREVLLNNIAEHTLGLPRSS
jgi:hypothetical protein